MPMKINASFANNRNNGFATAKTPSIAYEVGDFLVYTGLGGVIPYVASTTVFYTGLSGTFQVGETVTQSTSLATGVVVYADANGVVLKSVTGTLDATHLLTGGTSGATATASALYVSNKILGLSNEQITSASTNYATDDFINVSTPVNIMDYLTIPVSAGDATTDINVGQYVNVDPANPGAVDVSATGTQILVTKIVDADNIFGVIALTVA